MPKPDIGSKSRFLLQLGGPCQNIAITFGKEKLEWCGQPMVNKFWRCVYFINIIESRSNLFLFYCWRFGTSVAFVEMTSGSDFLRKMSRLRRKVRRRDVTRYMSPHLCSSCVLEYPACVYLFRQNTHVTEDRQKHTAQDKHIFNFFCCGWPTFWNALTDKLRTYSSDRFKLAMKTFLFATY